MGFCSIFKFLLSQPAECPLLYILLLVWLAPELSHQHWLPGLPEHICAVPREIDASAFRNFSLVLFCALRREEGSLALWRWEPSVPSFHGRG